MAHDLIQSNQMQAHVERLTQTRDSLRKYPNDARANAAILALDVALGFLNGVGVAPAEDESTVPVYTADEALADAGEISNAAASPGFDDEGNPLPPFAPPTLP